MEEKEVYYRHVASWLRSYANCYYEDVESDTHQSSRERFRKINLANALEFAANAIEEDLLDEKTILDEKEK